MRCRTGRGVAAPHAGPPHPADDAHDGVQRFMSTLDDTMRMDHMHVNLADGGSAAAGGGSAAAAAVRRQCGGSGNAAGDRRMDRR